jgi:hypothetical protein
MAVASTPGRTFLAGFDQGWRNVMEAKALFQDRADKEAAQAAYAQAEAQAQQENANIAAAKATLDDVRERLAKGEYVSQKEQTAALYDASAGVVDAQMRKMDIWTQARAKLGPNKYADAQFGPVLQAEMGALEMIADRTTQLQEAMGAATRSDAEIAAMEAGTEQGQQRVDIAGAAQQETARANVAGEEIAAGGLEVDRGRLAETQRAARVGEGQAERGLDLEERRVVEGETSGAASRVFEGRRVGVAEAAQAEQARANVAGEALEGRRVAVAEGGLDLRSRSQRIEIAGHVATVMADAERRGISRERVAEQLGGEWTAERLSAFTEEYKLMRDEDKQALSYAEGIISRYEGREEPLSRAEATELADAKEIRDDIIKRDREQTNRMAQDIRDDNFWSDAGLASMNFLLKLGASTGTMTTPPGDPAAPKVPEY